MPAQLGESLKPHIRSRVASTAANLAADKADLWDSGKTPSNRQNQIEYEGVPLTSRQRAFWKVRIWDQTDEPSAWSNSASWSMGLLDQSDWVAHWIGDPTPSVDSVAATMLRRRFTLAGPPARAVLYATALGVYEVRINGQRVGDHVLAPEFTDYHTRTQYQAYDITTLLHGGDNVIAALLGDGWYAGGIGLARALVGKARNIYGDHPRLLVQLELTSPSGATERIVTDSTWRVTRDGPIRSSDILNGESYDARREMPGWDDVGFDDTRWSSADVASGVATQLVAQPNEPIRVTQDVTGRIRQRATPKRVRLRPRAEHGGLVAHHRPRCRRRDRRAHPRRNAWRGRHRLHRQSARRAADGPLHPAWRCYRDVRAALHLSRFPLRAGDGPRRQASSSPTSLVVKSTRR